MVWLKLEIKLKKSAWTWNLWTLNPFHQTSQRFLRSAEFETPLRSMSKMSTKRLQWSSVSTKECAFGRWKFIKDRLVYVYKDIYAQSTKYHHIILCIWYILIITVHYITSILLNNDTTWNEKTSHTWCFCILFQVRTFAVQHVQWTPTSVLGELLNHWQQFQRLQRAIAVLQVETSKIQKDQISTTSLCQNDLILSDSNHQLQDLFTICRQCRTACIYTCQLPATVWFRLSAEFPYPTGWKSSNTSAQRCRWRARLQGPAAGAISPRSTHGDIPYRVVRGGTSPKFHCGLLCAARLMETQPRGETPSLWKEWQNFPNHFRALTLAQGPQVSKQVLYVVISCANLHKSIMWLKGEVRGQWAFVRYLKSKNIADNTKTAGSSMKLDHWYKPKNQKRSSTPHFVTLGL